MFVTEIYIILIICWYEYIHMCVCVCGKSVRAFYHMGSNGLNWNLWPPTIYVPNIRLRLNNFIGINRNLLLNDSLSSHTYSKEPHFRTHGRANGWHSYVRNVSDAVAHICLNMFGDTSKLLVAPDFFFLMMIINKRLFYFCITVINIIVIYIVPH